MSAHPKQRYIVVCAVLAQLSACADDGDDGVQRRAASRASTEVSEAIQALTVDGTECPTGAYVIEGTSGNDVLTGTAGPDCIIGYLGDDQLFGLEGDDVLIGERGHDVIEGGEGDDEIEGGRGDDELRGGPGADFIHDIHGTNQLNGGGGRDRLLGGPGVDTIQGGDGDDEIEGGDSDDSLHGGSGEDVVRGNQGADQLSGGPGNDRLLGGAGPDTLWGEAGADELEGGGGADQLEGGGCHDRLISDAEDTLVAGGGGYDLCSGASSCEVQPAQAVYCQNDAACGSDARCTQGYCVPLQYEFCDRALPPAFADPPCPAGMNVITGTSGDDELLGTDGPDCILGLQGADHLVGRGGDDFIAGGEGDDWIEGGPGSDTLEGGHGSDGLWGNGGDDQIHDVYGDDVLAGGDGNDELEGGPGADLVSGEGGSDLVAGDAGADTLEGGSCHDRLISDAADTVVEGGGGSYDLCSGAGSCEIQPAAAVYCQNDAACGSDARCTQGYCIPMEAGFCDRPVPAQFGDAPCPPGMNEIVGTDEPEELIGTPGADCIRGLGGADHLVGLGGDDFLQGGVGDDAIEGGPGADTIEGGHGDDELWGNGGDDVLRDVYGADRLAGGGGNDRLYAGPGDDTLLGQEGSDLLEGGPGVDSLEGNDCHDQLLSGPEDTQISGGAGHDQCTGSDCEQQASTECEEHADCASGQRCLLTLGFCIPAAQDYCDGAPVPGDMDGDGVPDAEDNCPDLPNGGQNDQDADGFGNACDNCVSVPNPKQEPASSGTGGAACASPAQPYCGNGVAESANGEECDLGFAQNGPGAACGRTCISNLPHIVVQPASVSVPEGMPATFSLSAAESGLAYQWRRNGTPIALANEPSFSLTSTTLADDGASFDCVVSNAAGSVTSAAATLDVTLAPPQIVVQPSDQTVAERAAASFSVQAVGSQLAYQWQRNGQNIAGATAATYVLAAAQFDDHGATFRVRVHNAVGDVLSVPVVLNVNLAVPSITRAPLAATRVEGGSVTFDVEVVGSQLAYQWSKNGQPIPNATASTLTLGALTLSDAGSYAVTVSNTAGSQTSAAAELTVQLAAPTITQQPIAQTVLEGAAATFAVQAQGSQLVYQWQRNGVDIAGANGAGYTLASAAAADDGAQFRVRVSNGAGQVTSQSAALSVQLRIPTITVDVADQTVVEGSDATFEVAAAGSGLSYQWRRNGANIAGATAPSYTLSGVPLSANGDLFRVVITNAAGSVTSRSAVLNVSLAPPSITSQPAPQHVAEGQNASFSVTATGSQLSYQWQRDGVDLPGASAATLALTAVTYAQNGTHYRCVVTNAAGSVTSQAASLEIDLAAPALALQPADQTVPEGAAVEFSVAATGSQLGYQWRRNGSNIAGATGVSYSLANAATADDGATFSVVVSNAAGSVTSREALLRVDQLAPAITGQPQAVSVNEGQDAQFSVTATGSGLSYQWRRNGGNIAGANASTYTLSAASFADHGAQFTVVVSNAAGSATSQVALLSVSLLAPSITTQPADLAVSENDDATFAVVAQGTNRSYQWRRNGVDIAGATGAQYTLASAQMGDSGAQFSVIVQNGAGSVQSSAAVLSVNRRPPQIVAQPANATVLEGAAASFSVTVSGTGVGYQWQRDGVDIAGATSASYQIAAVTMADDGAQFRVRVQNSAGSVTSSSATLQVNLATPSIAQQPVDASVIEGEDATFSVSALGTSLSYQWRRNGSALPGSNTPSLTLEDVPISADGDRFLVVVSNAAGQVSSSEAVLHVTRAAPVIESPPADVTVQEGASASFAVVARGTGLSYQWQRDGAPIAGATGAGYTLANAAMADHGARFRVVVTNSAGSVSSGEAVLSVTRVAPVIAAHPSNQEVDERQAVSFGVVANGSGLSYQWQRNGVDIGGAVGSSFTLASAALSDHGATFRVVVTNSAGSVVSNAATLTVRQLAPVIAGQPQNLTLIEHETAIFSVNAVGSALAYQWQRNGADISGATGADYTLNDVSYADHGASFRVRVSNAAGFVLSQPAVLSVNVVAPVISSEPADADVEERSPVTFSVSASGSLLSYQWQRAGVDIPGATAANYTIADVALSDHGALFRVVVTNPAGSVQSRQAELRVRQGAPVIVAHPASTQVLEGDPAFFNCSATGSNVSYEWERNGQVLPGETNSWLSLNSVAAADDGSLFRCAAVNAAGRVLSTAATLSVSLRAPVIVSSPQSTTVVEGSAATFGVVATGTALTYQWYRGAALLGGATGTSYTTPALSFADNGVTYSVHISNSGGSVNSSAAMVTVTLRAPEITVQPSAQSAVEGAQAAFSVTAVGTNLSYQWRRNAVDLSGASFPTYTTPALTLADHGAEFTVVVSNAAGSITSSAATLSVTLAPPAITQHPADVTVLEGAPASFSCAASGNDVSYAWYRNGAAIAGATQTTYAIAAADYANDGALYHCVASNGVGSVASDPARLTVTLRAPQLVASPASQTVQVGTSVSFSASVGGSNLSLQWQRDGADIPGANAASYTLAGVSLADDGARFRLVASNAAGSVASQSATLSVVECFAATYTPQPTSCGQGACAATGQSQCVDGRVVSGCTPGSPSAEICNGLDDDCNGSADNLAPRCAGTSVETCTSGAWVAVDCRDQDMCNGSETCAAGACAAGTPPQLDDGNPCTLDACTNGVLNPRLPEGSSCGPGRVCDAGGVCVDAAQPPVITTQPQSQTLSVGRPLALSVAASGVSLSYQWSRNGAPIDGATQASYGIAAVAFADSGAVFRCRVSNVAGAVDSAAATLTVIDGVGPVISLNGSNVRSSSEDRISLSGSLSDLGSGVASIQAANARLSGQSFGGTIDPEHRFRLDVLLMTGENVITLRARDVANNETTQTVSVSYNIPQTPLITITAPAEGSTTSASQVTVRGTLRTTLAAEQVRLRLEDQLVFPSGSGTDYAFEFAPVALQSGVNVLTVRAETPFGTSSKLVSVTRSSGGSAPSHGAPVISLEGGAGVRYVSTASVRVAGIVQAQPCVSQVRVNGAAASLIGSGTQVSFSAELAFAGQADTLPVSVQADDCDGLSTSLALTFKRDTTLPQLTLTGHAPPPAVNHVLSSPFRVTGTVVEANLAGLALDDASLSVVPTGAPNTYSFSVDVPLSRLQQRTLAVRAWDLAGQSSTQSLIVALDANVGLELLSPRPGTELRLLGDSASVEVLARATALAPGDRVRARVDSGTPVLLALSGSAASGSVTVSGSGNHTLHVEVIDAGNTVLASTSADLTLANVANEPLALERHEPANASAGNEVNRSVTFFFNRPVNPQQLAIDVVHTVHGESYKAPPIPPANFQEIKPPEYVRVDLDRAPIPGRITVMPGNSAAIFTPLSDYVYGSEVFVTVRHDAAELARFSFRVRPLPTLAQGFIMDTLGEPVVGLKVSLPGLQRESVTDENGAFFFGFAEPASRDLPPGTHRMLVNPGLADRAYGTLERWIELRGGRLTFLGPTPVPTFDKDAPFAALQTSQATTLLNGDITLDVSQANVSFADGRAEGSVRATFLAAPSLPYKMATGARSPFVYNLQPYGTAVNGPVRVELAMPTFRGNFDYAKDIGQHVLITGLDPDSLEVVPVGVGTVDMAGHRVRSVGALALRRLDILSYAPVALDQRQHLVRYVAGEIDFEELIRTLGVSR